MAICLVWGMVGSLMSLMMSKWHIVMGVKRVENNPHYSDLVATIHQIAQRAGKKCLLASTQARGQCFCYRTIKKQLFGSRQ